MICPFVFHVLVHDIFVGTNVFLSAKADVIPLVVVYVAIPLLSQKIFECSFEFGSLV